MTQTPINVTQKVTNKGCGSSCGSVIVVLLLAGLAYQYWYVWVPIAVVAGAFYLQGEQRKRRRPPIVTRSGPRDPWLTGVAQQLAPLGLVEKGRNTGQHLGGVALEGDIALQSNARPRRKGQELVVFVNLFADPAAATAAADALTVQPAIRDAVNRGITRVEVVGPVLVLSKVWGDATCASTAAAALEALGRIPPPSGLAPPATAMTPIAPPETASSQVPPDVIAQIRELAAMRDAGVLTDEEFQSKKTELLDRL